MPSWIGLPNNAEKVLLTVRGLLIIAILNVFHFLFLGQDLLRNMLKMSDDELAYEESAEKEKAPSWMNVLSELGGRWLKILPEKLIKLKRTKDNVKDPLFRFFEREINVGLSLLKDIRTDLDELLAVCRGEHKQSNHIRALASALNKGQVPASWRRYTVPKSVTVMEWMNDFVERVKQLSRISHSSDLRVT